MLDPRLSQADSSTKRAVLQIQKLRLQKRELQMQQQRIEEEERLLETNMNPTAYSTSLPQRRAISDTDPNFMSGGSASYADYSLERSDTVGHEAILLSIQGLSLAVH